MAFGEFTCPYCNVVIASDLGEGRFVECNTCHKSSVKDGSSSRNSEALVEDAETLSPIIIGSKGKVNGDTFEVIGCITLYQLRTSLNLFSILWNNGSEGYLIDWDGDYAILSKSQQILNKTVNLDDLLKRTKLDGEIDIPEFGMAYCYFIDKIESIAIKGTGKAAFEKYTNSVFCAYFSEKGKVAYSFISKSSCSLLTGISYEFNELNLNQTRTINGWYK